MGKIIHRIKRFALLIQIISFNFAGNIRKYIADRGFASRRPIIRLHTGDGLLLVKTITGVRNFDLLKWAYSISLRKK
jgi:hypothetical protein